MYVVRSSDEVDEQIAQLPHDGAARFAELRRALELDPWSGDPYVRTNPNSAMRTRAFAAPGTAVPIRDAHGQHYRRAYAGCGAEWPGDDEIRRRHIVADDGPAA